MWSSPQHPEEPIGPYAVGTTLGVDGLYSVVNASLGSPGRSSAMIRSSKSLHSV